MNALTTASGREVFPVGIGTFGIASREDEATRDVLARVGCKNVMPVLGNEVEERTGLRYSLENGQNYVDTAGLYGRGYTNEVVGAALREVFVETPRKNFFVTLNVWKNRYNNVQDEVRKNIDRLGVEYLDVAGPHSPHTQGWDVPPWEATMEDFAGLMTDGLIRGISVSNFSIEQIKKAKQLLGLAVTTAQAGFNIFDQGPEKTELRDYCVEEGIQFVGYRALSDGVLKDKRVGKIAADRSVAPAQLGLAYAMSERVLPIAKALNRQHINDNIAAASIQLDPDALHELAKLGR
jgi:2,5-diketo-D-gluconate reductase B